MLAVVGEHRERAWPYGLSTRRHTGHRHGQKCAGSVRQPWPLPQPRILHNISQGQGQQSDAPNGVAPVWCATGASGWLPRNRMRSWRTSGSVGRAPGHRCLDPEPDTGECGWGVAVTALVLLPGAGEAQRSASSFYKIVQIPVQKSGIIIQMHRSFLQSGRPWTSQTQVT